MTAQQQRALDSVDSNINMLRNNPARVAALKEGRALLVKFFAGQASYKDLPVAMRDQLFDMPAWGTYGT